MNLFIEQNDQSLRWLLSFFIRVQVTCIQFTIFVHSPVSLDKHPLLGNQHHGGAQSSASPQILLHPLAVSLTLPKPLVTRDLCSVSIALPLPKYHINGTI